MKQYITIIILTISLLLSGGFIIKNKLDQTEQRKQNFALNKELMKAKLDIGRAETKFGNASSHAKDLEKALRKEIKQRNSIITRYGKLKVKYNILISKDVETNIEISNDISLDSCTELQLKEGQLYVAKDKKLGALYPFEVRYEDHRITIGCAITPRVTSSGIIPVGISYNLNLKLKAEILETVTPSGAVNNYINIYEVDNTGKTIGKLKIESFAMVVDDQRTPKFLWWDPHMDIGIGVGLRADSSIEKLEWDTGASVGFSPISYGLSSKELAWRFGRLSLDIGREVAVGFTPILYNVGENLPLFNNLWVGTFARYGLSDKNWSFGVILGATL